MTVESLFPKAISTKDCKFSSEHAALLGFRPTNKDSEENIKLYCVCGGLLATWNKESDVISGEDNLFPEGE
jgi:hypothetical protein